MLVNLDKLLERGEKIEVLVKKSDTAVDLSSDMKGKATKLKNKMWWRNAKMYIIIAIIAIILIYIILGLCCGFDFSKC
jgi:vesicle-associated membrane protein 7